MKDLVFPMGLEGQNEDEGPRQKKQNWETQKRFNKKLIVLLDWGIGRKKRNW